MTKERAVTTHKLLKRRVRARMSKTGEGYTAARRHVVRRRDRLETDRTRLASAKELASDEKLTEATGQDWEAWLSLLDRWGARDQKHGETVAVLMAEHGVPGWWAQTITTGYERARGLRLKHQQPDGFTVYASKTVGVPIDVLFKAFVDEPMRRQWLTDGSMALRTSQPGKVARFEWGDGPTRVFITFEEKGPSKSTAYVTHERLADPGSAEMAKALWKKRVVALKAVLEADR
jgi:hypothetical protein